MATSQDGQPPLIPPTLPGVEARQAGPAPGDAYAQFLGAAGMVSALHAWTLGLPLALLFLHAVDGVQYRDNLTRLGWLWFAIAALVLVGLAVLHLRAVVQLARGQWQASRALGVLVLGALGAAGTWLACAAVSAVPELTQPGGLDVPHALGNALLDLWPDMVPLSAAHVYLAVMYGLTWRHVGRGLAVGYRVSDLPVRRRFAVAAGAYGIVPIMMPATLLLAARMTNVWPPAQGAMFETWSMAWGAVMVLAIASLCWDRRIGRALADVLSVAAVVAGAAIALSMPTTPLISVGLHSRAYDNVTNAILMLSPLILTHLAALIVPRALERRIQ